MVGISSRDQFKAWLEGGRSQEVAEAMAGRCALRVLPLLGATSPKNPSLPELHLKLFRALAILRSVPDYTVRKLAVAAVDLAKAAINAATDIASNNISASASFSLNCAIAAVNTVTPASFADDAATAAATAAEAAMYFRAANASASQSLWQALSADASRLEANTDVETLLASPLWPEGQPKWFIDAYSSLDQPNLLRFMREDDGNWAIWDRWYADRLEGGQSSEWRLPEAQDREMAAWLIGRTEPFWQRPVAMVNAEIGSKLETLSPVLSGANELPGSDEGVAPHVALPIPDLIDDAPVETEDQLERGPYALFLARRLHAIWCDLNATDRKEGDSFILHIDAPWGGGKTSFANFVARVLNPAGEAIKPGHFLHSSLSAVGAGKLFGDKPYLGKKGHDDRGPWIVVHYNAWRDQYVKPPWWHILLAIRAEMLRALRKGASKWTLGWIIALWRRCHIRWAVSCYKVGGSTSRTSQLNLIVLIVFLPLIYFAEFPQAEPKWMSEFAKISILGRIIQEITFSPPKIMQVLGAFFSDKIFPFAFLGLSGLTLTKVLDVFRQNLDPKLEFSAESRNIGVADPIGRFRLMFDRILRVADRPVLLVIDDIDRCDAASVVEIMRGFQTILRSPRLFVVLLGDMRWIETAHNVQLKDMAGSDGELGARFVQKAIQLSFRLPLMSARAERGYTSAILGDTGKKEGPVGGSILTGVAGAPETDDSHSLEVIALEDMGAEPLEGPANELPGSPVSGQEYSRRVAAVVEASIDGEKEQRLSKALLDLFPRLPRNPRQIKRIVMAFSIYEAVARIYYGYSPDATHDGEGAAPARKRWMQLARWVTLATEWPNYWRVLARSPELLNGFIDPDNSKPPAAQVSDADMLTLLKMKADQSVRAILHDDREDSESALDAEAIYEFNQLIWETDFALPMSAA